MNKMELRSAVREAPERLLFKRILFDEVEHGTFCLVINRPKTFNSLNREILEEIAQAIDIVESDSTARVLLLTGPGEKAFVARADIEFMSGLSTLEGKVFSEREIRIFRRLENLTVPVIALVDGYAWGRGCEKRA